ncbi:MAG: hypothetical protein P0107_06345 [Nitrosomonas sp.]|nr:hypothetical protein [Nitrosomonas sp.]
MILCDDDDMPAGEAAMRQKTVIKLPDRPSLVSRHAPNQQYIDLLLP